MTKKACKKHAFLLNGKIYVYKVFNSVKLYNNEHITFFQSYVEGRVGNAINIGKYVNQTFIPTKNLMVEMCVNYFKTTDFKHFPPYIFQITPF